MSTPGADIISLPAEEIGQNVFKYLTHIKERGKRFGVVLAPSTPLSHRIYQLQIHLLHHKMYIYGHLCNFPQLSYKLRRKTHILGIMTEAIAAAIIGGTSFFGGKGKIPNVIVGALILGLISNPSKNARMGSTPNSTISFAVIMPVKATMEPIDKSIPAIRIAKNSPHFE